MSLEIRKPRHVAIIMDGNGRWGDKKFGQRVKGHIKGVRTVRRIVRCADEIGLEMLTLWGFSTDNWKRPENEVNTLMNLFRKFIIREADELYLMNVQVTFIGSRTELPEQLQIVMDQIEVRTEKNNGLKLQVALNYGGKAEILQAMKAIVASGVTPDQVTEALIEKHLQASSIPDPDLVIRTGNEVRTSGFMPWQSVHAEWSFSPTLWPEFTEAEFVKIIDEYSFRDRRKGALSA